MSFKAIRSRLRSAGDSDQGSPSRTSLFNQLTTLLGDEQRSLEDSTTYSNGGNLEEELLSLVMNNDSDSAGGDMDKPVGTTSEQINSPLNLRHVLLQNKDSFDMGSDRDSDGVSDDVTILRNRTSHHSVERPARYRFSHRDKRRSERSKSLDRTNNSHNTSAIIMDLDNSKSNGKGSHLPHRRIAAWARELIDDFQSIDESNDKEEDTQGSPLTVKRLKNNIVRFGRATKPVSQFSDSMTKLRQWQSPTASILFLLISMYALWHGLLLSLIITICIWRLTVNYFKTQWMLNDRGSRTDDNSSANEKSSGVTDRLSLLLQVARNVQNQLGAVCDGAEKIKNLLMWRHEATRRLYLILWLCIPVTLFISTSQLMTILGFYLLIKLFIVDFIFFRFPRLRAKYDTSSHLWQTLPTDADLDARQKVEQGLSNVAASNQNGVVETRTFWEMFNLPQNETPLPGWQSGLRCTIVNRDKSLTSSFKTGRLFLTCNYLCFERSKTHPHKNIVIPLDRIVRLEKGNQYSWIPGGGMIIEVFVQGIDRAYTFGAIMNRDEAFAGIRDAAEKRGCIWEEDKSASNSST